MAKRIPLDVAFSLVLKNPKFKKLRSGERGAYVSLCWAAILDGKFPLPASPSALARLAGCARTRWGVYAPAVMAALADTLPVLFERYAREKTLQVIRSNRTKKNCAAWHEKLRAKRIYPKKGSKGGDSGGRELLPKKEAISLSDNSHGCNPIQPTKAPRHTNQRTDMQARQLATNNKLEPFRFIE